MQTPPLIVSSRQKQWNEKQIVRTLSFIIRHLIIFIIDLQLVSLCVDFYLPALNSISVTLQFLFQRFHFQPEILKKCQDEIDRVVGQGRLPSLNDRIKWVHLEEKLDRRI